MLYRQKLRIELVMVVSGDDRAPPAFDPEWWAEMVQGVLLGDSDAMDFDWDEINARLVSSEPLELIADEEPVA